VASQEGLNSMELVSCTVYLNYHIITFPGQSLSKNRETQFGRGYGPVARQTNT
jgi:hypothetical protein